MKILLPGGAGFIGSNVSRHLLDQGHSVTILDNLSTGNPNIMDDRATFIEEDICELEHDTRYDVIINLACPASPDTYKLLPLETLRSGSIGVENLIKLAITHGSYFIQASTSEVYGDPLVSPQPETYYGNVNSYGPRSCYDESKRYAEALIYSYNRFGLRSTIIRIFNTYGPYMDRDDGRVVTNFIRQALRGEDITVYGNGTQTRSLCYIDDLARGIDIVLKMEPVGRVINLGNDDELSIETIARTVKSLTDSSSNVLFTTNIDYDDPQRRKPDLTVARSLGYEPSTSIVQGLKKTIEYMRSVV